MEKRTRQVRNHVKWSLVGALLCLVPHFLINMAGLKGHWEFISMTTMMASITFVAQALAVVLIYALVRVVEASKEP